jgi:histidinol dehydrogenase
LSTDDGTSDNRLFFHIFFLYILILTAAKEVPVKILDSSKNSRAIDSYCRRRRTETNSVEKTVRGILERVRSDGDAALRYYTKRFDGVRLPSLLVTQRDAEAAYKRADPAFIDILEEAAANIRTYHEKQIQGSWYFDTPQGSTLGQRITPVERAGIYIPGGKAAYPSTVLMNVIPAQVAGVSSIALVSPPDAGGSVNDNVLVAARILGITEIFRVGGAQAIGALAYGTTSIRAVDKIVGPGNIFVATAKKLVYGIVGIDSFAGPSEIVILADENARAAFIAADMLAQAEHDEHASSVLITTSKKLIIEVGKEIQRQSRQLTRSAIIRKALEKNSVMITTGTIEEGAAIVNSLAPEHLEIITADSWETMKQVRHAGAIFLGNYSPVAIGDYYAGPNHTLPTSSTARFSSPLGVEDFCKRTSVIAYTHEHLQSVSERVAAFARKEGLQAHSASITIRTEDE